jgi:hypothetical protein
MSEFLTQKEVSKLRQEYHQRNRENQEQFALERLRIRNLAQYRKPEKTPCIFCQSEDRVKFWLTNKEDIESGQYLCHEHSIPFHGRKGSTGFSFIKWMTDRGFKQVEDKPWKWLR